MPRLCRAHLASVVMLVLLGVVSIGMPLRADAQSRDVSVGDEQAAAAPAHIAFVDGAAVLERDGRIDDAPGNMPLLAGDRVRTQTGRIEILFADNSTLHLDANTTVDFQSDDLVRLLDGRVRLSIPPSARSVSYRIDAPSASAEITQPGEYRVAVLRIGRDADADAEVELAVLRGSAALVNENGRTPLRAGERAYSRAHVAPSYAYAFNSASWDAFDRWSEARRSERLGVSAEYLPEEVRPYAASFERYGSWQYDASYGNVWYPTVSSGWRPYYNGRWVTLRPYGWTWVGADPWAWPTHHYGRWGISAGVWFWIPGRSWGPAWVSWAYAPGYVSWCPLGWNNRAIVQINRSAYGRGYDPWGAWTAVPQRHFGVDYVNTHYVAGRAFDARTRGAFVPRTSAPEMRGHAVPRASAPIRVAGTDGRRVTSPIYTNLEPGASRVGTGPSRVMVGPPRDAVAAVPRAGAPGVRSDSDRAVPRADAAPRTGGYMTGDGRSIPRAGGAPAAPGYTTGNGRAVSREDPIYRAPAPSPRIYEPAPGNTAGAPGRLPSRSPGDMQSPRSPFERRAPDPDRSIGAGRAMPRPPDAQRPAPEYRPNGMPERRAPEPDRPSGSMTASPRAPGVQRPSAPENRPAPMPERRAPAPDRQSERPSARPAERAPDGAARSRPGTAVRGRG